MISPQREGDAYRQILEAIDLGTYRPGDRLVEAELAERFGFSRTPIREALQRLETQGLLVRDGRSLMVAQLNHDQLSQLYTVRTELEALAARLAAQHATDEEIRVLRRVSDEMWKGLSDPDAFARDNKKFHHLLHLASHNNFLVQQLSMVHRSMALLATAAFDAEGRPEETMREHELIVEAITARDSEAADKAIRAHISSAYETRLLVAL